MTTQLQDQIIEAELALARDNLTTGGGVEKLFLDDSEVSAAIADSGEQGRVTHSAPDKVTIYSMQDGTPSTILVYMLAKKLRQKLADGRRAFTLRKAEAPTLSLGTDVCYFHVDHPRRQEILSYGIKDEPCSKTNLRGRWEAERHAELKHPRRWKALEAALVRIREDEARDLQRAQLEAMQMLALGQQPQAPAAPRKAG